MKVMYNLLAISWGDVKNLYWSWCKDCEWCLKALLEGGATAVESCGNSCGCGGGGEELEYLVPTCTFGKQLDRRQLQLYSLSGLQCSPRNLRPILARKKQRYLLSTSFRLRNGLSAV